MRTLLARHGETEWNTVGRRQGRLDSPLTALGCRQAEDLAAIVDGAGVDLILSSPQGRARTTARTIAGLLGVPLAIIEELAEVDNGTLAGLTNAEIDERFPGLLTERAGRKYSWRFPGGESYEDADRRSAHALREVEATGATTPLIVSHAMVTRMLVRNLLDLDPDEALAFNLEHGVVIDIRPDEPAGLNLRRLRT